MAKQIVGNDLSKVPASCMEIVKQDLAMRKAWDGASAKDRAQHAIAARSGTMNHHQLQRREYGAGIHAEKWSIPRISRTPHSPCPA
jgi:hypothetical protein